MARIKKDGTPAKKPGPKTNVAQLKIDGPIVIETPEANKVEIVETPEKTTDAPKICKPLVYDDMIVRELEGQFGRYRRVDVNGKTYIDFHDKDGLDVISRTVDQWRESDEEKRKAALILGVEL